MKKRQKKILVTGAAGYIAGVFLQKLKEQSWVSEIIGLDKAKPQNPIVGVQYLQSDILTPQWSAIINEQKADVLVHLAYVLKPLRDKNKMHEINYTGTRKTMAAAVLAGAQQILCSSSATAYGVFPDNPVPLTEESPIRIQTNYQYTKDKGLLEQYYQVFANQYPHCKLSIIRPVTVFGPSVSNHLSRFLYAAPIVPLVAGGHTPMQFVHEEDVAGVMVRLLELEEAGPFNVAADDWITGKEMCQMLCRPTIPMPRWILYPLMQVGWCLGLRRIETPGSILDFFEYPWVVSTDKVKHVLKYQMKYTSREAVKCLLKCYDERFFKSWPL